MSKLFDSIIEARAAELEARDILSADEGQELAYIKEYITWRNQNEMKLAIERGQFPKDYPLRTEKAISGQVHKAVEKILEQAQAPQLATKLEEPPAAEAGPEEEEPPYYQEP